MKISQMLLGAIALSLGITIAVANSETEQSVKKCVLPFPEVDNDTTKKQTKPISDKVQKTQKKSQHRSTKQLSEPKTHQLEKPIDEKLIEVEQIEVEPTSPRFCPNCGMG